MKFFICPFMVIFSVIIPGQSQAWTRARLTHVDVALQVNATGDSEFITQARFEVNGGRFHGFDLAPQDNRTLVPEKCFARVEGALKTHVKTKTLFDGRTRIVLANRESIKKGAVVFTLVHTTNLKETGELRKHNGRARLDWTPIIWDHGTDAMSVSVMLPGQSAHINFDNEVVRDYDIETHTGSQVKFKKFRTVKWYPMQVVLDFDASLVGTLPMAPPEQPDAATRTRQTEDGVIAGAVDPISRPPLYAQLIPTLVALLGLLLIILKSKQIQNAHWDVGIRAEFKLLKHTGFFQRFVLSAVAIALGNVAQLYGSVAASVPALAVAAAIWLMGRSEGPLTPRAGGHWRAMTDGDVAALKKVLAAYKRRRMSMLDISTIPGVLTFVAAATSVGMTAWVLRSVWPTVAFAVVVTALIWILPVWFSFFRSELPVDAGIESFNMLKRWKRGLTRLIGKMAPEATANYWIREDDLGPIEVRLRVQPVPADLHCVEIATEVVKSQSAHRIRKVAILKMAPGTETARRLAACPNAVEHHLTPDLKQEIIVLRNRRGKHDVGFAPLRNALLLLRG